MWLFFFFAVIVFLGFPTEFRAFMLQVRTENMTNGDYVYVVNEPFHHRTYYGNLTWMYGTQRDQEAEQAFKSVFLITSAPETNTHLQTLENELKMRSLRDFNFTYAPDEKPNLFAIASYECVIMFGIMLQHILHASVDLSDGSAIGRLFWNKTFNLDTGIIQFDEVGERKQDMIVQQFQKGDVWPTTILELSGSAELHENVTAIEWPVPFPPPNEPFCGYSGLSSACLPSDGNYSLTTIISCSVFALAIIATCAAAIKIWFGVLSHHEDWQTFVIDRKGLHPFTDSARASLIRTQISSIVYSFRRSRNDL
ncbi:hypothetical protein RvY_16487-2 [Ramazzottius varieornatus]|uniref:Receptor ligand binding region domain-containing protein n=1 Tax=Ramazzottius varieornatus TaxID=947166 RepID=A0A1D1VYN0_RAMVA|nr:hypothetical protein RvY_16487-2 [Ramazzottius varieornatus]